MIRLMKQSATIRGNRIRRWCKTKKIIPRIFLNEINARNVCGHSRNALTAEIWSQAMIEGYEATHHSAISLLASALVSRIQHTISGDLRYTRWSCDCPIRCNGKPSCYVSPQTSLPLLWLHSSMVHTETDLRIGQKGHGLGPRATPSYGDSLLT